LKKQSKYLNTVWLSAAGVLILYVVSRFIKMKKPSIPKPTMGYKPTPLLPSNEVLSFDEIYQWLRKYEGKPSYTAVKDGKDKKGNQLYSIGLGHQIQPNESYLFTKTISDDEVLQLFAKDIEAIRSDLNRVIKVPITKNQQLALLSLRYNIGADAFNKSSLLAELNKGNYTGAALKFADWKFSEGKVLQGLVNRRTAERELFSIGIRNPSPLSIKKEEPKKIDINFSAPFTIPKLD
jgi:GH24 family phage-related lysozyme (muramidase)